MLDATPEARGVGLLYRKAEILSYTLKKELNHNW